MGEYEYSEEDETKQQIYIKECLRKEMTYDWPIDYPWLDCSQLHMTQEQYFEVIRKKMSVVNEQKERINKIYREQLPKSIQWGEEYENWRFMVALENRDEVLKAIFEKDLFAGTNFPSVSWMFKQQHSVYAEEEANHILNLFNDHRVNEEFAHRICKVINEILR